MFELKRSQKISEEIKMGDEVLTVSLDAGEIQGRFAKCYNAVIAAEQALKKVGDNVDATTECLDQYGRAVIALFQLVFGEENATKILAFYEGNYTEMVLEVYPFIKEIVVPKVTEAAKAKNAQLKKLYR